jgi:hypothetical protein
MGVFGKRKKKISGFEALSPLDQPTALPPSLKA